jgi:CheY-like chemotaxis protein
MANNTANSMAGSAASDVANDLYVLVVMEDTPARSSLDAVFRAEGFSSHLADSGLYALTMLERNPIDVVVIAKEASDMSGQDFYEIVVSDTNLRRVLVVLLDNALGPDQLDGSSSALALAEQSSSEMVLEQTLAKLRELGRIGRVSTPPVTAAKPSGETIEGTLDSFFSLVDLILSLTGKNVTGELHCAINQPAVIFFYKGQLLHARVGEQIGEDALVEIFYQVDVKGDITYRFEDTPLEHAPKDKRSIDISVEKLLFQVTVELDYRRKGNFS